MVVALLAVSGAYGFHGDEMYYVVAGQHPAFGYVDQPPLTPLLSAGSAALMGVTPTAVRVLPSLEMGLVVVLVALVCRDLGGTRRAQVLAACTAALSGYLGAGHLNTTTDPDLLVVCRHCEVAQTCLSWAIDSRQDAGVWGGLSEDERHALKRRNARAHRAGRVTALG